MKDKIGIVTAAGSGMGRAGALRFAAEGASVAVVDLDAGRADGVVDEIGRAGGRAFRIAGDLSDEAFARRIVHDTVAKYGGLDFVWNHVGHPGPSAFEELDLAQFDSTMNLNLRTVVATTMTAIPFVRSRGGGAFLFTSSTSGLVGSPFSPTYSAGKFAVIGLSRSLAKRYGREKIRFNVVCPGTTDTPMLRVFVARPDQASTAGQDPEELVAKRGGANPMGRAGKPEEIANAALFLLSDEASFITGALLSVDGGAAA
jgi:NAD(P)-dependent dehydrogenase (short-subunit alcohol dehydrogenase family)